MDIAQIPIVDFLKYCKEGARSKGYSWIVCILCRSRDCKYLYKYKVNNSQMAYTVQS